MVGYQDSDPSALSNSIRSVLYNLAESQFKQGELTPWESSVKAMEEYNMQMERVLVSIDGEGKLDKCYFYLIMNYLINTRCSNGIAREEKIRSLQSRDGYDK